MKVGIGQAAQIVLYLGNIMHCGHYAAIAAKQRQVFMSPAFKHNQQ